MGSFLGLRYKFISYHIITALIIRRDGCVAQALMIILEMGVFLVRNLDSRITWIYSFHFQTGVEAIRLQ